MVTKVFKNFEEYWKYARHLSENQRDIILSGISQKEKTELKKSYKEGGWEDLEMRNIIDKVIEEIKEDIGVNLIQVKVKVSAGNSVYLKRSQWEYIQDRFISYKSHHSYHAIGGITTEYINDETVLLLNERRKYV